MNRSGDGGEEHDGGENDLSVEADGASTERLHKEPGGDSTDTANDEHDKVEGGGLGRVSDFAKTVRAQVTHDAGRKTSTLEVVCGLIHERGTASGLNEPDDANDLGSSEVDALEAVKEADTDLGGLLELIGVVHHSDLLPSVRLGETGSESKDRLFRVVEAAFSGQPPRTRIGSAFIPV